jgi:hypothetical protein
VFGIIRTIDDPHKLVERYYGKKRRSKQLMSKYQKDMIEQIRLNASDIVGECKTSGLTSSPVYQKALVILETCYEIEASDKG